MYLFLLFPILDKNLKKEPIIVKSDLWLSSSNDSITYYYIEEQTNPTLDALFNNTIDSVFICNFKNRQKSSVTLKDPNNYILHFTNNYSSSTLYLYSTFIETRDSVFLKYFMTNARWMKDNIKIVHDTIAIWTNDNLIYDKYNLKYGWASAYAQGYGLSVLCRAYQQTNRKCYLELAEKVLNSFNYNYKFGGITSIDNDGNYWYLEYPADPPGYVLNGMIFGLFGIWDYYRLTKSSKAELYFNRGIATLKKNLEKYDKGYWSAYDLEYRTCAGYNYHKNVHIPQLDALFNITGEPIFKEFADRFRDDLKEPNFSIFKLKFTLEAIQRWLTYKNPVKILFKKRFR